MDAVCHTVIHSYKNVAGKNLRVTKIVPGTTCTNETQHISNMYSIYHLFVHTIKNYNKI